MQTLPKLEGRELRVYLDFEFLVSPFFLEEEDLLLLDKECLLLMEGYDLFPPGEEHLLDGEDSLHPEEESLLF